MLITPANLNTLVRPRPELSAPKNVQDKQTASRVRKKGDTIRLAVDFSLILLAAGMLRYSPFNSNWKFQKECAQDYLSMLVKPKSSAILFLEQVKHVKPDFPKFVEFVEAKNLDEAKAFAKKYFKIEKFDVDNLEIANWVNRAISKYNNMFEGKRILPKNIVYGKNGDDTKVIATMQTKLSAIDDSTLFISKNRLENTPDLIDELAELARKRKYLDFYDFESETYNNIDEKSLKAFYDRAVLLSENKDKLTNIQKLAFEYEYLNISQKENFLDKPENLKHCLEYLKDKAVYSARVKELLKRQEENKLLHCEQVELIDKMVKESGYKLTFGLCHESETGVLFHEFGHLAYREKEFNELCDFYRKRLELIAKAEAEIKKHIEYFSKVKNKIKHFFIARTPTVKLGYNFSEAPYYEAKFEGDEKIIATMVSDYSKESPCEFVAETFASLCENSIDKFSKEIIDLYKKFKGPLIEFFEKNNSSVS